ncbi:MAG: ATP-binding protein [Flavobacteriales bacterium]|nr:ATP-binding protein [Flavobacteriales bacterium]
MSRLLTRPSVRAWRRLLLVLLLTGPAAHGQVDSLVHVLERMAPGDTGRFKVMNRIARKLMMNQPDSALTWGNMLLEQARKEERTDRLAVTENLLGTIQELAGRRLEALAHFQEGLRLSQQLDRMDLEALIHGNIAHLHAVNGDLDAAVHSYRRSIASYQQLKDEAWAAGMMDGLANVYARKGALDSADQLYERAAEVLVRVGSTRHAALSRHAHAQLCMQTSRYEMARRLEREALAMIWDWDNDNIRCKILGGLFESLYQLDSLPQAIRYGGQALAIAERAGYRAQVADYSGILSRVFERSGQPDSALFHLQKHIAAKTEIDSKERKRAMDELQVRFESERKDAELALNRATMERRSLVMKMLVGGAIGLLIALLFFWRAFGERQRMTEELASANERMARALSDKELLLREIHHRVKNNLQMVGSLLRMQGRGIQDPVARDAVRDSQDRVRSMALIHQDLYQEDDVRGIDMPSYVDKLARGLIKSHGIDPGRIAIDLAVPPLRLDVDTAIPIGLILNELIVNALKHAFPDGRSGLLRISLQHQVDGLHLEVSDDGIGYSVAAVNSEGGAGFGLGMLRTFAEKLQAEHEMVEDQGTTVRLHIRNYKLAG